MRALRAVEFIASLSIRHSGASIQRQVAERKITIPDEQLRLFWELLVILGYLASLYFGFKCFVSDWLEAWQLGIEAIFLGVLYCVSFPAQAAIG